MTFCYSPMRYEPHEKITFSFCTWKKILTLSVWVTVFVHLICIWVLTSVIY